jgi:ribose 5-phosphate isomerase
MPGGIADPYAADQEVGRLPGVVSTGLFLGLADVALLGDVRRLGHRADAPHV